MKESPSMNPPATGSADPMKGRLSKVGTALGLAFGSILEFIPGVPHRPNPLAKTLGVNRAVTSHLIKAIGQTNPLEILHVIPGPEPLRKITARLVKSTVPKVLLLAADKAIEEFEQLIAEEAGTRPALDALISHHLPGARAKLELASRYSVFKGISQLKGIQGELWLGTAVITPSKTDPEHLDLTWINGATAMQRMRPGVDVRFSYRYPKAKLDHNHPSGKSSDTDDVSSLEAFCTNPPARLSARTVGDAIHYHLPDDILGPKDRVDMFVADHHPASIRRYAKKGQHGEDLPRTALFVEIAIPVANLVFDVLLHKDAFPDSEPELYLYDTGYNGVANVNDETRDHERVDLVAPMEVLDISAGGLKTEHLPNYVPMLEHLAKQHDWDLTEFRGHRLNMQYPVLGWQVSMAFAQVSAK